MRWYTARRLWVPQNAGWLEGKSCTGGVLLVDVARYRLPIGLSGILVHRFVVRCDIERIFGSRQQKIAKLLANDTALAESGKGDGQAETEADTALGGTSY